MPINVSCVTSWRTQPKKTAKWPLPKVTTVTEIVLDHFQKWRQLQRSYLTTSKSDDSYRDRNWPLPKVTTVTEIVLDHFQKWRQLQRSYLTISKSDDSYKDRTSPLPKVTTVTEIVLDHFPKTTTVTEIVIDPFQKRRQLQRSYLTTSKSDDSYRDRNWPLPKVTTVTEIVLDHFQKWRQLKRSYVSVLQKWRQSQRSSPDRSFRARLPFKNESPKSIFDDSHTRQARGKPAASPRQAEPAVSRELTFDVGAAHFSLQNTAFREPAIYPNHTSSCKNDNSHRDRTSPLPKVTTVTEIVLDHFQKWRQLQRSYLTTSKSDDSYRDRTWPLPKVTTVTEIVLNHFQKWRQSQRSLPNRSFRARLPSKTNLQSQFLTTVTRGKPRGKPAASPRQAEPAVSRELIFDVGAAHFSLAKHSISRAGYLPKSYFKLQKWQQLQRS